MPVASSPAPKALKWKIFYGDGSTATDQEYEPENVPKRNVQVVVMEDLDHGRYIDRGNDFYLWRDWGAWYSSDIYGLWDYLEQPGAKIVLFGRSLPNKEFKRLQTMAIDDDYLPEKTSFGSHERQP